MDNFNTTASQDQFLDVMLKYRCRILFTTRSRYENHISLKVDELNPDTLLELVGKFFPEAERKQDEIKEIMAIRCTIPNVSAVVFKNDKRLAGYFEEAAKFKQVGDWYLYLKILEDGKISYNRKACNKFRIHGGSVTRKSRENRSHFDEIRQLHKMLKKQYTLDEKIIGFMDEEEMRVSIEHGIIR